MSIFQSIPGLNGLRKTHKLYPQVGRNRLLAYYYLNFEKPFPVLKCPGYELQMCGPRVLKLLCPCFIVLRALTLYNVWSMSKPPCFVK